MDQFETFIKQEIASRQTYRADLKRLVSSPEVRVDDDVDWARLQTLERRIDTIDAWIGLLTEKERIVVTGILVNCQPLWYVARLLNQEEDADGAVGRYMNRAIKRIVESIADDFEDMQSLCCYLDYGY